MARRPQPAFLTGTSTEYLGRRPLRRIVAERPVVMIMGPAGVGKTAVAQRIAAHHGSTSVYLDPTGLDEALMRRTRAGAWADRILDAPTLVVDGPSFLNTRAMPRTFLVELLKARCEAGRRTLVCAASDDTSLETLMDAVPRGSMVTLGLRFPESRSGRMRFARRMCDELGLARSAARGTDALEPWNYGAVIAALQERVGQTA